MYYPAITLVHENCKARKTCQEEEAKDASSIIYVEANKGETFTRESSLSCRL